MDSAFAYIMNKRVKQKKFPGFNHKHRKLTGAGEEGRPDQGWRFLPAACTVFRTSPKQTAPKAPLTYPPARNASTPKCPKPECSKHQKTQKKQILPHPSGEAPESPSVPWLTSCSPGTPSRGSFGTNFKK